jgi:hypothetical protein
MINYINYLLILQYERYLSGVYVALKASLKDFAIISLKENVFTFFFINALNNVEAV